MCLQDTCLEDTHKIIVRGFNGLHKFRETENRTSGGVSILVNENIPQSIVILKTKMQDVAVNVKDNKTITLYSVYLPPPNQFNFNSKDFQDLIDQLPSPFCLMGEFNGRHSLWGSQEANNRGQQLEDLIVKQLFDSF